MKHLKKRQIFLFFTISLFLVPFVAAPLFNVESADESLYLSDGFRSQKYSPFSIDLMVLEQIDVSVYRLESVFLSESLIFSSIFQTQSFEFTGLNIFEGVNLLDSLRIIPSPHFIETMDLGSFLDFSYLRFYPIALSVFSNIQEGFKQYINPRFNEGWSLSEGFRAYLNPVFSEVLSFFDDVVSRFIPKVKESKNTKTDRVPRQRESSEDGEDLDVSDSVSVSVTRAYRVDVGDSIQVDEGIGGDNVDGYSNSFILGGAFLFTALLAIGINSVINKVKF